MPPPFDDPSPSLDYWLKRERLHRAVIAGKVDVSALRGRIKELELKWLAQEEQIMSAESPDEDELAALAASASREEQSLIEEFSVEDWQEPCGKNRYTRYWKQKNEKLGVAEVR